MCSEYTVSTNLKSVREELGTEIQNLGAAESWDQRVRLTTKAPILFKTVSGDVVLDEYVFPVQPFPNSRLSSLDSKTLDDDDPQVKRIYDLPTWKKPFESAPCLVPMTSFIEPVYWGDQAGTAQEFKPPTGSLFFIPGIRIHGRVPKTEKAFSLLTHTPSPQMLHYHHRLLVMLKPSEALAYLDAENAQERFDYLLKHRWVPNLKVTKNRNLAKGWEKKIEGHTASLASEKHYLEVLKHEGVRA
jgi:putative SOS response-associated peptidase YedK